MLDFIWSGYFSLVQDRSCFAMLSHVSSG